METVKLHGTAVCKFLCLVPPTVLKMYIDTFVHLCLLFIYRFCSEGPARGSNVYKEVGAAHFARSSNPYVSIAIPTDTSHPEGYYNQTQKDATSDSLCSSSLLSSSSHATRSKTTLMDNKRINNHRKKLETQGLFLVDAILKSESEEENEPSESERLNKKPKMTKMKKIKKVLVKWVGYPTPSLEPLTNLDKTVQQDWNNTQL